MSGSGEHFGEHVQELVRRAIDGESVRTVACRRGSVLNRRGSIGEGIECGGKSGNVIGTIKRVRRLGERVVSRCKGQDGSGTADGSGPKAPGR